MPHRVFRAEDGDDGESIDYQELINKRAIELYREFGIEIVATNDAHYVNKDDYKTHDILLAIQTGSRLDDPDRWRFESDDLYLKSLEEMIISFKSLGYIDSEIISRAIANTYRIADKISIEIPAHEVDLPKPVSNSEQKMLELLKLGWEKKISGKKDIAIYKDRMLYELGVIKKLEFIDYFLIVWDIINYARNNDIMVGAGRGSAAGSLICYLLDITQVDPIEHGLYFERFLNPERIDLPDIDIDFQDDRRHEVFEYITNKYGKDKTAHINTFGYLTPKSAFRDVCRVYGINVLTINKLSKLIETIDDFETNPELSAFAKKHPDIIKHVKRLDGTIRQVGVHAAGIVVSAKRLDDCCVLEKRKDVFVCNWDKIDAEKFGLLKIDVLGLSTLTILNNTKKLIKQRHGVDIDFNRIDLNDSRVLDNFAKGNTVGIFQFENHGMRSLLKSLNANTFDMVADTTALFRPGSLHSGQTDKYVKIVRGEEYEHYAVPELEGILKTTKSIMIYQEQIMQIFVKLANFSWAKADKMRKIIGKKLGKDEFEKYRKEFVDGCLANGIKSEDANELFDAMVEFSAYSFNKSHAVAYTYISFWSMFFKTHYPLEFMAALLTNALGNEDRLKIYYAEAKRLGIKVDPIPDINKSTTEFNIDVDRIIAPFTIIKGIGETAAKAIVEARNTKEFVNYDDFVNRVNKRVVNTKIMELLHKVGVFSVFGEFGDEYEVSKARAGLIPIYDVVSEIKLAQMDVDKTVLNYIYRDIVMKYPDSKLLAPKTHRHPLLMVINNSQKNEDEHLTADGTKYILGALKLLNLNKRDIYYTGLYKHVVDKEKITDEYKQDCFETLLKEIKTFKPKLIICTVPDVLYKLADVKGGIKEINGNIYYVSEIQAFLFAVVSPQWAFFNDEANELFLKAFKKLSEILTY